jgi:hypothetical protein
MGILTPFKAKPKDLAAAEARAAERDRAETETRACILENAQARKAALLADASVEHIEQLDAAARQLHIALEKLALVRPILLAEVDGLRDAARRKLRAELLEVHRKAVAPYVKAHRQTVTAWCGLHAAVAELRKAGFGRDADSLPVPPLHVVEMSGVAGTNGQILGNPNLDIFEDTAVRVHEQLAGGAK